MIEQIQQKIDFKTKPLGALGQLETLASHICLVQNTLSPSLSEPTILVFAADHGITQQGVSAYPKEVTAQMVLNFLNGGAAINVFCQQNKINLQVIDAGVDFDFSMHPQLIDAKIAKSTHDFSQQAAMSETQLEACFAQSKNIIQALAYKNCNIVGFGEMGIGNTSSASMLMSALCQIPIADCVGLGTGVDAAQLEHKIAVLTSAQKQQPQPSNARQALQYFGGFEIAQICGAMLAAYEQNMLIMVDGFIATSAFLCAHNLEPNILKNAIFCHQSHEQGHQKMLQFLGAKPILSLGMRLGEGTGCAVAYPIIQSAVNFINQMASFESAGVSHQA